MWALVIFTFATSSVASATMTTLEFNTQQLCLMAVQELKNLTDPVVTQGVARYKVLGTCVQTSEVVKK
jgi:putative exporter of polyketide antibiotics